MKITKDHCKKTTAIIAGFLLLIIFLIVFNGDNKRESINDVFSQIKNYDRSIFKEAYLNKTLTKSYIVNQNPEHFSSAGLTMPLPNLYNAYWVNNIIVKTSLKVDRKAIDVNLIERSFELETLPFMIKTQYVTGIYNKLGYTNYDEEKIVSSVLEKLDEDTHLFYKSNRTEDINQKLATILSAIKIFNNIQFDFGLEMKSLTELLIFLITLKLLKIWIIVRSLIFIALV